MSRRYEEKQNSDQNVSDKKTIGRRTCIKTVGLSLGVAGGLAGCMGKSSNEGGVQLAPISAYGYDGNQLVSRPGRIRPHGQVCRSHVRP